MTTSHNILVLNKSYKPIKVVKPIKAFGTLLANKAEIINKEDGVYINYTLDNWIELAEYRRQYELDKYNWIKTSSISIPLPNIIRLLKYDKINTRSSHARLSRKNIFERDNNTCQYCGKYFTTKDLSLDHVIPKSRGGKESWDNLVCACIKCNLRKSNKLLHESGLKLIREPMPFKSNKSIINTIKHDSWDSFVSELYWNIELK